MQTSFPLLTDRWRQAQAGLRLICVLCRWDFNELKVLLRLGSFSTSSWQMPGGAPNEQSISFYLQLLESGRWHVFFQGTVWVPGAREALWTRAPRVDRRQAFVPYAFIKVVAKADFSMLGTQPRASPLKPCPAGVLIQLGKQMRSM